MTKLTNPLLLLLPLLSQLTVYLSVNDSVHSCGSAPSEGKNAPKKRKNTGSADDVNVNVNTGTPKKEKEQQVCKSTNYFDNVF